MTCLASPEPRVIPASRTDPSEWLGIACVILLPLVYLLVQPDWIFPSYGIDSWIYLGFFRNYPQHQGQFFPGTYYGSRLSWVLPGYLLYRYLPPLTANAVLHLGVYYLAVFSLYSIIRSCVGTRAAALAAMLMGAYNFFLLAVGWDYVDGVGIAYYLLMLALLVAGLNSRRPFGWMMAAGAAAAAMVYGNIFLICYLPSFPLAYLLLWRQFRQESMLKRLPWHLLAALVGAAALTVLLGIVNRAVGGEFLFFMPSIRSALSLSSAPNRWRVAWAEFWWRATWVVPSVLALVGSVAWLLRHAIRPVAEAQRAALFLPLNFLLCLAAMLWAEYKGNPVLQYYYYASYMVGPVFLLVGLLLGPSLQRLHWAWAALLAVGTLAMLSLTRTGWLPYVNGFTGTALIWALAAGLVAILLRVLCPRHILALLLFLLGWGVIHWALFTGPHGDGSGKAAFVRINRAIPCIQAETGSRRPTFWYDVTEPQGYEFSSLASTYLCRTVNEKFPSLQPPLGVPPEPGSLLVIVSARPNALQLAQESLAAQGLTLRPLKDQRIRNSQVGYMLTMAEVLQR